MQHSARGAQTAPRGRWLTADSQFVHNNFFSPLAKKQILARHELGAHGFCGVWVRAQGTKLAGKEEAHEVLQASMYRARLDLVQVSSRPLVLACPARCLSASGLRVPRGLSVQELPGSSALPPCIHVHSPLPRVRVAFTMCALLCKLELLDVLASQHVKHTQFTHLTFSLALSLAVHSHV